MTALASRCNPGRDVAPGFSDTPTGKDSTANSELLPYEAETLPPIIARQRRAVQARCRRQRPRRPACADRAAAASGLVAAPAARVHPGRPVGAQRAARRSDSASSATAASGMTHHAGAPALAISAVAPSATATPSAVTGSSPTTNSHTARAARTQPAHAGLPTAGATGARRSHCTSPSATSSNARDDDEQRGVATRPRSRRRPRRPRRSPNEVSITPTENFIVFSGTRASGARTATPARTTTTHRDAGGHRGQADVVLAGAEREHDERDLEALEQHALERDRERVAVEARLRRLPPRGPASVSAANALASSRSAFSPAARSTALRSHCSPNTSSSAADDHAQRVDRERGQGRSERGDDHRQRRGRGADAGAAPSASCA